MTRYKINDAILALEYRRADGPNTQQECAADMNEMKSSGK